MIQKLVDKTDPVLREVIPEFDFTDKSLDPVQIAVDLADTMVVHRGLGLAANQIGMRHRVFALTGDPVQVCFNPRIVDLSEDRVMLLEGCLSYPDEFLNIRRPRVIKVRFTRPNGETVTERFDGITARIVLHEIDHLDGLVMHDRASVVQLEKLKNEIKKKARLAK